MDGMRRWFWPAATAALVVLLTLTTAADGYLMAQFAVTKVRNELGPNSRLHLTCYRKVEDKRWYRHGKGYRWVKIFELAGLHDGEELVMPHPGLPFVQEKVACEFVANKRGGICSWTIFDDDTDPADGSGNNRSWYLRPDGIYDEITTPGRFKRGTKFQYRYCRAFHLRDLIHDELAWSDGHF